MIDLIIIGGGPAGLSAALYVLRAGYSVKIYAKNSGALEKAESIENYFGLEKPVSGISLLETGRKQAARLGGEICSDEVTGLTWNNGFVVSTPSGKENAKSVLIAVGAKRKRAAIKNLDSFEGLGVSYCAVCDAFFYRGKNTAVLGSGEFALSAVNELINIAGNVYLLTNGVEISAVFPGNIKIYPEPIEEILGEKKVTGASFKDGSKLDFDGIFVAQGTADGNALAREAGIALKDGKIITDENMKTNIPGAFAAGDCTGGVMQVAVAVGEGAKAGLSAVGFLRSCLHKWKY